MSALDEALSLKRALEKAQADNSHSSVQDVLKALQNFTGITQQILKETKLGNVLKDMKMKYDKEVPELGKLITSILKVWTKIAKTTAAAAAKEKGSASSSPTPAKKASSSSLSTSSSDATVSTISIEPLPSHRQKIVDLLSKTLLLSFAASTGKIPVDQVTAADAVAREIEHTCWFAHPCDQNGKQTEYTAKIRTLNFNLKKNEALRTNLLSGAVTVPKLMGMSAAELASNHVLEVRAMQAALDEEARRQDWSDNNKVEILSDTLKSIAKEGTDVNVQDMLEFIDEVQEVSDDDG